MNIIFSKKWTIIIILATILVSAWLYRFSFSSYFFQDDWFSLQISKAKNLNDFLVFFIPRKDVIYYRPLGMQVPFFLLNKFFGLNSLPFRMVVLVTHAVNIFLVYTLVRLLLKDKKIALMVAFFYGTSAVHFLIFYWFAIYAFILGPAFFFLSFILYILYLKNKNKTYYFFSLIIFFMGLATNEIVSVLPIILFFYELFLRKKIIIKRLIPYFFLVFILLLVRFIFFTPPSTGVYQLSLGKHILSNLKTYLFWSFNWSEKLTEQMISMFVFNDKITGLFSNYALTAVITFSVLFIILWVFPLILIIVSGKIKSFIPIIFFGFVWFISGLLPVLFFTDHKFSYYLPIPLVGLLILSLYFYTYLIRQIYIYAKCLVYFLLFLLNIVWLWSSIATVNFNTKNHWAPWSAFLSKNLINNIKSEVLKQQSLTDKIYIPYLPEYKSALNDQDAFKVVFGREDIITIYTNDK